jgi:hypothetical protein
VGLCLGVPIGPKYLSSYLTIARTPADTKVNTLVISFH